MLSYSIQAPRNWMKSTHISEGRCLRQLMDSNAHLFQKHHLRNSQNQCHIKLTNTETIKKGGGHSNRGLLLRILGLFFFVFVFSSADGVDLGLGRSQARGTTYPLNGGNNENTANGVSYRINEMMHVETLALDLAQRRSSINESFPSFPLLAPGFFIPHDYPLFLQQEGKKKGLSIYMRTSINQNSPKLFQQPTQRQAVGGHRKDSTPLQ